MKKFCIVFVIPLITFAIASGVAYSIGEVFGEGIQFLVGLPNAILLGVAMITIMDRWEEQ